MTLSKDALTIRRRFLNVEHDHDMPPCIKDGKHTSSDSPCITAVRSQALK